MTSGRAHIGIRFSGMVCNLIGGDGSVNPAAQVGHTGVHGRGAHVAVGGAPGHDTHKVPSSTVLAHQGATRITLRNTRKNEC